MIEEEISKLYRKINEFKFKYEVAKQFRIDHVNSMEDLDKRLSELEEEIKKAKLNSENNDIVKIKESKHLKECLLRTVLTFLVSMVIIVGIDWLQFKDLTLLAGQWQFTLFINTLFNMSPFVAVKVINKKNKVKTPSIEELEKEYQETLEKRLVASQKYKSLWEEEVLAKKIYKAAEIALNDEIIHIETTGEKNSSTNVIDTKDIYHQIKLDPSFILESPETKKEILDEELRKYLAKKVSEYYYNAVSPEDLESFTAEELVRMLAKQIPENEQQEKLGNIIHAVINFAGNMQGYSVVWYEETNETLINSPEITFDEQERWTELKTHKNTNYEMLFNMVYDTFINNVMKTNEYKTKVREKEV